MSASLGLYRLQQVDRQIDRVRAQLDAIRKTLENNTELNKVIARLETARTEHHAIRHQLTQSETDVQTQKIKIQQTESSLYGGNVHNPKELQDLQKDLESLKKHLGTLEERELEVMMKAETAEQSLKNAEQELEALQTHMGSEHKKLLDEQSEFINELKRLGEEREASINPIDSSLLAIYDELRNQKRGLAVTEFSDGTCASCGSTLTAALQQSAKSPRQLAYCPSCGRILYAS